MNNCKVVLVKKASGENFSIEAGLHDGERNFDHHGEHSAQPCPARNESIKPCPAGSTIEITHLDADTLIGVYRLLGWPMPEGIDLQELEDVDLNGSTAASSKYSPTMCFMVGLSDRLRSERFPRNTGETQDVSGFVRYLFLECPVPELIENGRKAIWEGEKAYRDCQAGDWQKSKENNSPRVGLWVIGEDDPFDPSRPYRDGFDFVVVFRRHYRSISIYAPPNSGADNAGKTLAGVKFAGHPCACGSPRGEEMNKGMAEQVAMALL